MALPTQISDRFAALGWQPSEVQERFVLGSGRGGQKIQKTSSCVHLRHAPTGIEVRCQGERSQAANRIEAWLALCLKLEARAQSEVARQRDEQERNKRRHRQKSPHQKARMVEAKKRRAGIKRTRGRIAED